MTDMSSEYNKLRRYLNPSIKGTNTGAVLYGLATDTAHLVSNVEAVSDQIFVSSASAQYRDPIVTGKQ